MERKSAGSSASPVWLLVVRLSTASSVDAAAAAASGSELGVDAILGVGVRAFPDHGNMWGKNEMGQFMNSLIWGKI